MKKAMKKLLCLVLVLMIAIPFAAFPASAEDGDGLTRIDTDGFFTGANNKDSNNAVNGWKPGWDGGITATVEANGNSVTLSDLESGKDANISKAIPDLHLQGKSYTILFTLTAGDNDEEVGIMLDHQSGFVINPGQNTFRYYRRDTGTTYVAETKYTGTGEKTQTYAIEIASTGSGSNSKGQPHMTITHYKLYNVTTDDTGAAVWNLACDLSTAVSGGLSAILFDWGSDGDCDDNIYMRFWRSRKIDDAANSGSMIIKNFEVYEGLVAKDIVVETREYYKADDGDLLYTANFNGNDGKIGAAESAWGGMDVTTVINGGNAVILRPAAGATQAATYRYVMDTTNYPAKGNSYTMVFTATASDKNQEIGLYPDWQSGFVVVPGKNQFKYNETPKVNDKRETNVTIVDYTEYEGTYSLTQTYAVEFKLNDNSFSCAEYNLYVAQNGKWVLLYSLDAEELAAGPNWSTTDYEVVIDFYRDCKTANQNGYVTVSNFQVYKGLAAKSGKAAVPGDATYYNYNESAYGDLIYKTDFNGDAILRAPKADWAGMNTSTVGSGGKTLTLKGTWSNDGKGGIWGAKLNGYDMLGRSYTTVFTVKASDDNEEIGFLPDHWSGFVVNPGQNTYRFINTNGEQGANEEEIKNGNYNGNGSLTQTYAIEIKSTGTSLDDMGITAYNLYVEKNGEWMLVCALTAEELAGITFDWGADMGNDNDFVLRFYHARNDDHDYNNGTITISNYALYKGLAATTGKAAISTSAVPYDSAPDGTLLYDVNFNGTSNVFTGVGDVYDGMNETFSDGGYAINLKTNRTPSESGSVYGGEFKAYTMPGNAYTVVFTVSAEDADQSVGIFLKWKDGFVITPGQNSYYLGHAHNNGGGGTTPIGSVYGVEGTYKGTGALTQTYAIEIASGAEAGSNGKYECTAYNLYVLQDGAWVLVCALDAIARKEIAWNETDYEFMLHLARISEADGENAGRVTISDMSIYKGNNILPKFGSVTGASVRIKEGSSGIRFTGSISKAYYDELVAQYGADKVQVGMLITPTDYLVNNGLAFTKEALDACGDISGTKYLEIDGTLRAGSNDDYYKVNCAMTNVKEGNYNRSFSARLYVKIDGEIVEYAAYNLNNNSRSIAEVAERAYNDVQATADSVYKNEITLDTGVKAYSPYTDADRKVLKGFFPESVSSSITVMTYNIRTYGDADSFWDKVTGNYEGWAGRDPKYALETITELMPDVVGLQEDDSNLEAEYKNVPALANNYELYNAGGNGNENNGIWVKKGINVIANGTVSYKEYKKNHEDDENISNADWSADTKGTNNAGRFFRWVLIEKDGVKYLVVNTHLHYKASGSSSVNDQVNKNLRKGQATLIRLWLADVASNPEHAAYNCYNHVVMGDMNAQGDSQEMFYGLDNGDALNLAANDAIIKVDCGGTLISEGFVDRQPWVYDHIFYSPETLIAYEFSVVDNYDASPAPTNYPSDHLPVVAKFTCK